MGDTNPPLSLERFKALAEAYGSVFDRWPARDREAASAIAETPEGHAILAHARKLDRLLDGYRVPEPSSVLAGRVLEEASRLARRRHFVRRWWAGLGLAGVGLAGALTAAVAVTVVLRRADMDLSVTADAGPWGDGDDLELDVGRDAL